MKMKIALVMLALIAVGVFMLPDLLATFAGSHTMEKSDPSLSNPSSPANVDLKCTQCHGYISAELEASNSSIETELEHKQVAYLSPWTTYSSLGDTEVPSLISFVVTGGSDGIWSRATNGPQDAGGKNVSWVFLGPPVYSSSTSTTAGTRDPINNYAFVYYAYNGTADTMYNLTGGSDEPHHVSELTYKFVIGKYNVKWADVYNETIGRVEYNTDNATNLAAWDWTNQTVGTGTTRGTDPTIFLGSKNIEDLYVNGTPKDATKTSTMTDDNDAQCYVCHRAGIFNVTGSHTKVTVRGCTDNQCHGADSSKMWTGNASLQNTSYAYRSKFGEYFQLAECSNCHYGALGFKRKPANEVGATIGDSSDAHNRWFEGLKSSSSTYKDENGNAISADYYTCLGCHTHVGMKITILRPSAFDISISKQNVTTDNYVYDAAPTLTINNTANATNTSIKDFGSVWQR